MSDIEVFGDFPPVLYRSYSEEQYARDLVDAGKLRIYPLAHYQTIEDGARRDAAEGVGRCAFPGPVESVTINADGEAVNVETVEGHIHATYNHCNVVYLCCCSFPPSGNPNLLPKDFGRYTVAINDPAQFARDIAEALIGLPELIVTSVEGHQVRYDKGEQLEREPSNGEGFDLSFTQKPKSFSVEHEFRLVVMTGQFEVDPESYVDIDIGRALEYVDLI